MQVLKSCTRGSQLGLQHVSSCKGGHVGGCQAIPTSPRPRLSDCQGYSRRFRGLFLVPCRVPRSICSPSFPVLLINFLDLSSRIEPGEEICSNYLDDPETTYCARSLRQVSSPPIYVLEHYLPKLLSNGIFRGLFSGIPAKMGISLYLPLM